MSSSRRALPALVQGRDEDPPQARADRFTNGLVAWQKTHGRHTLPWQHSRDPYRIWLSEIMLQQTQVATVLGYYERFLARFPTLEALAAAPIDDVMALWSGLGYYSRARNLHASARLLVGHYGGCFPTDPATLATLPGIGRSTAAAIAVFSAGARAAILDANVKRVLCRAFGVGGDPGSAPVATRLWQLAESLLPAQEIERYTQGLMDFGSAVCQPRTPQCSGCFYRDACVAWLSDRVASLPERRARSAAPSRHALMLLLHSGGRVLIEKRDDRGVWGGLWSLPQWPQGPDGGAEEVALARAVAARYGTPGAEVELAPLRHGFTHFHLTARILGIDLVGGSVVAATPADTAWLALSEAQGAPLPAPVKRLLTRLWRASPHFTAKPEADQGVLF